MAAKSSSVAVQPITRTNSARVIPANPVPTAPAAPSGSPATTGSILCSGFEGQVFRKNRCKKCLRDKTDHVDQKEDITVKPSSPAKSAADIKPGTSPLTPSDGNGAVAASNTEVKAAPKILKKTPNGQLTDKPPIPMASNSTAARTRPIMKPAESKADSPSSSQNHLNTTTQTIILSKNSPQIRRASSSSDNNSKALPRARPLRRYSSSERVAEEDDGIMEIRTPLSGSMMSMVTAVESASDLQSMHSAVSGGSMSSLNSAATFTSSREHFQDTVEEMQATINALTEQLSEKQVALKDLEQINSELKDQLSTPLKAGTNAAGGTLRKREDGVQAAQKRIKELERENAELNTAKKGLQSELDQMRECMDEVNDPDEANQPLVERVRDVTHKLQSAEMMCEDLMDDNEELKKELRSLEAEMDELHDNFRQDQAVEFQTIQKDLEQTMKNCRILQFKLRKAERKCDELEADKSHYEVKLRQITSVMPQSVVINSNAPAPGNFTDNSNFREMESELKQVMEVNKRLQAEIEHIEEERNNLKLNYDVLNKNCMEMEKQKDSYRLQAEQRKTEMSATVHTSAGSQEYDINQLLRDLYDSVERETDLRDQLKFAEEESKRLRKQMVDMEHENDSLQHQLKKISSARPHSGDFTKAGEQFDSVRSNEETKLQLEVAEHEISSLKRRLNEAEQANENLTAEIKKLKTSFDELRIAKDKISSILEDSDPSPGPGKPRSYYEQKIKLLEAETNDLRKKLVDKERQLERLTAEVDLAKRKGVLNRSKSLDDGQVVDLRRQLQMTGQEITVLRQKSQTLEGENDRLSAENKRLHFKVAGKRGSGDDIKSKSVEEISSKVDEEFEKHLPDIAVLASAGKTAKDLVDEIAALKKVAEEQVKVISTARDEYAKILEKSPMRKDIATRQELKSRIDELEKDMQSALMIAEQEGCTAKRLLAEVEDLRSRVRRKETDLPMTDEVKEYRMKLYVAEQENEALKTEIKELQSTLVEERRRIRSSDTESINKERLDTELRNLKQELGKQRYMVEELTAKDNMLSKQVVDWQKKYHSLKDAYKSDTDAWQKELIDFEQELHKEKMLRQSDVGSKEAIIKSIDKELQSLKTKSHGYEEQIRSLTESAKLKEKETKDQIARLKSEIAKEQKALEEQRLKCENHTLDAAMQEAQIRSAKDRLEQRVTSLTKELDDNAELYKKENSRLKTEAENAKKAKLDLEKNLQDAKNEAEKMRQERGETPGRGAIAYAARGLSAYERAKAADQIKEEVEKLHKQNFDLQKQLLDAKRASDDAVEQSSRNERKWTCEKDEVNRKLRQDEKIHKAELSAVTMRSENKQKLLEDETKTLNSTVKQLRKERDALQERLDNVLQEMQKLRDEHADSAFRLETTSTALIALQSAREGIDRQLEDLQTKVTKAETERTDVKNKAAKDKSSYELRISELQNKLSQYEGQHAKLSAYALKTRQMAQNSKKANGEGPELSLQDIKDKLETTEKALKKAEKDAADTKTQIASLQLDKERESDLLRAKIRELQDKHRPLSDAHNTLKLVYDSLRTEYEVILIERDDLASRLAENESSQIKERGKIDQILAEIQRLKEVAPLFSSEEDLEAPMAPKRPSRIRARDSIEKDLNVLPVLDAKKYKGKKSADLQKAIDNITKVSEDIKAERKTRRPVLPHKRSQSASFVESGGDSSPVIRRYPSVDTSDPEEDSSTSLPTPTPLKNIPKTSYPNRNPRFPSIPPSFLVTPPSTIRDNRRSRSHDTPSGSTPITEETFHNPGGSWDSIDSDVSAESWSYPLREAGEDHFVSLPNLPQKVDSATSTADKPKRSLLDKANAKRKKMMARLRPLSLHSSAESIEEKVVVSHSDSSGFFERLSHPGIATQTSRTPSPSLSRASHSTNGSRDSKPTTPVPVPNKLERPLSPGKSSVNSSSSPAIVQQNLPSVASASPYGVPSSPYNRGGTKQAIPAPRVQENSNTKSISAAMINRTSPASSKDVGAAEEPIASENRDKEIKFKEGKSTAGKPYINAWRKPISDLAKKFESKGK